MPASTVPVSPFRGYRFPPEIITHALYHRFALNFSGEFRKFVALW